jgi:triacylglycerol esterase/lipase EstA (alpha/beta hydrolase family)
MLMIKKTVLMFFALALFLPAIAKGADLYNGKCSTQYPIFLAHGMGMDNNFLLTGQPYWYNIKASLEKCGAKVIVTDVNAMGKAEYKAVQFAYAVELGLAALKTNKCHIIAHSHGNVYTRYAINKILPAGQVASFTGIGGVNRGTKLCNLTDILNILPNQGKDLLGILDAFYGITCNDANFGDPNGNTWSNLEEMRPESMKTLDAQIPDVDSVYYQTFTGVITIPIKALSVTGNILFLMGEPLNDGLVSTVSARWGNYRGVIAHAWWSSGLDHANEINQLFGIIPGFDGVEFYTSIVNELMFFEKNGYPKDGFVRLAKPSDLSNRNCSDFDCKKFASDSSFATIGQYASNKSCLVK